jgi:hypothetical protein
VAQVAFSTDVINFVELIWERLEYIKHFGRSLKGDLGIDDNIKVNLKATECKRVDWIHLAYVRDQW